MKYSIMGFSQEAIIKINKQGLKIDTTDLLILRWFVDFSQTEKMAKVMHNGNVYYWINYQALLDDLPILNIGKRMLSVRLQKMVDAKILTNYLNKNGGTFTMFGFGENYEHLISNMQNISRGDNKFTTGVTINLQPKNQSTKENPFNIISPSSVDVSSNEDTTNNEQLKISDLGDMPSNKYYAEHGNVNIYNNIKDEKADFPKNDKYDNVRLSTQILEELISKWNDIGEISKVREIKSNTRRYKRIKEVIKEYGYQDLIDTMNIIKSCPFLRGNNDRNWKITMDWFLEPNNYQKVRDGNYISHHNNYNNNTSNPEENENAIGSFLGQ